MTWALVIVMMVAGEARYAQIISTHLTALECQDTGDRLRTPLGWTLLCVAIETDRPAIWAPGKEIQRRHDHPFADWPPRRPFHEGMRKLRDW